MRKLLNQKIIEQDWKCAICEPWQLCWYRHPGKNPKLLAGETRRLGLRAIC
jgi:hypothetical protein